jgi:hypothetical protein
MTGLVMLGTAVVVTALHFAANVWATPALGFAATTIMSGTFGEIDVLNKPIVPDSGENDRRAKTWLSLQKAEGRSDLYVQSNIWQPGGSTGWHTHPGNSLIIVTEGTITEYEGPDPECKPHVYTRDMTFVDPHGHDNHVHIIRNEGNVVARTTAIQLTPAGAARRIDAADPGNCHF